MYPKLTHQLVLERTARFQRDADRYRRAREAREAHIRPPQPVRTAIELRLSACLEELECLIHRRGSAGRSTQ